MSVFPMFFTLIVACNACLGLHLSKHRLRLTGEKGRFQRIEDFFHLLKDRYGTVSPLQETTDTYRFPPETAADDLPNSLTTSITFPSRVPIVAYPALTKVDAVTLPGVHMKEQIVILPIESNMHRPHNLPATTAGGKMSPSKENSADSTGWTAQEEETFRNRTLIVRHVLEKSTKRKLIQDEVLWTGIAAGSLISISLFLIGIATFRLIQHLRRKHGMSLRDLSTCNLREHKLDKNPVYVRLSQLHDPKTGNHYVVTVLDESARDMTNDWSSEEEIFNVSAIKGMGSNTNSPIINVTSTPIKEAPVKTIRRG